MTGTPLTTSARISALNIVGELLRKVGVSHRVQCAYVYWSLDFYVNWSLADAFLFV